LTKVSGVLVCDVSSGAVATVRRRSADARHGRRDERLRRRSKEALGDRVQAFIQQQQSPVALLQGRTAAGHQGLSLADTAGGQSSLTKSRIATVQSYSIGSANMHPSNTRFHGPIGVHVPNDMSIGSAVFARLTIVTDRQTYRQVDSRPRHCACNSGPHLRT